MTIKTIAQTTLPLATPASVTPMMAQYLQLKAEQPDALLLFRLGDFYELFFADAITAARDLDLTLTSRGVYADKPIPMCGVPAVSVDTYIPRLLARGHKVAICEQVETPLGAAARGGKVLLARRIDRIITAGTVVDDGAQNQRQHTILASLVGGETQYVLAWADVSTGEAWVQSLGAGDIFSALERITPREIIVSETAALGLKEHLQQYWSRLTTRPAGRFTAPVAAEVWRAIYNVISPSALGDYSGGEQQAIAALLDYMRDTQIGRVGCWRVPKRLTSDSVMRLDAASLRNLDIIGSGGLLEIIDACATAMGARALQHRVLNPSTDSTLINQRLDAITLWYQQPDLAARVAERLKTCPDGERALTRIALARHYPRDLAAVRDMLAAALACAAVAAEAVTVPAVLRALEQKLREALASPLPAHSRDGGMLNDSVDAALAALRAARHNARLLVQGLEKQYIAATGISGLKIQHNNLLGYYVQVSSAQAAKMPDYFKQKQGLAGSVRYTSDELQTLEQKLNTVHASALTRELELYQQFSTEVAALAEPLLRLASQIAELDIATSQALVARARGYSRPQLVADPVLECRAARHAVVERALQKNGHSFTPNDCTLSDKKLWLLTGPNMGGKSTYLRQNALLVVLAQAGLYVPAAEAVVGIVDQLFCRVGAHDDLARGQSTFMVEMQETAAILHQATARSLVVLDEIGRGTATHDGMAIAWAVAEAIHNNIGCRCLFATHYHELAEAVVGWERAACYQAAVKEWQQSIIMLHKIMPGAAGKSYGVTVARLAGVPEAVVQRAAEILATLEQPPQGAVMPPSVLLPSPPAAWIAELAALNLDDLSPREALEIIYQWQRRYGGLAS